MKHWKTPLLALLAGWGMPVFGATATENELKAAYLFQFSQFVAWPESAWRDPDRPFVIGIVGESPLEPVLNRMIQGEQAAGRPIEIRRLAPTADARGCQILYFPPGREIALPADLGLLPILTVGEAENFLGSGGVIRFKLSHNRIKLHINLAEAESRRLAFSSKLLRIADKVERRP